MLEALLDSWDRKNTILLNLLRALPAVALELRPMDDSPSIAQQFTHMHFVRLVFVLEDAPEFAGELPAEERAIVDRDPVRIARMLDDYDHRILMLQHLIWHEGFRGWSIAPALLPR